MCQINMRQLKIINALIEQKSAVSAAKELNISPSSISYALNQLKKQTGQVLFLRTRQGLRPTEYAVKLQEKYAEIAEINAEKSEFVIATYSLIEMLLADHLHPKTDSLMHFTVMGSTEEERLKKLKHREVDIDIGGRLPDDRAIVCKRLVISDICTLANRDHPRIKDGILLDDWNEYEFINWQRGLDSIRGFVEQIDYDLFMQRKVVWTSPNLLSLAWHCAISKYLMVVPKVFLAPLQKRFPLQGCQLPERFNMSFDCFIHYHQAMEKNIAMLALDRISDTLTIQHPIASGSET
ncbi:MULTISPECIES: LysR family transcriptional regulator [unclassified Enterobacter]|uniref:LysR family transcriptional regulator n=1 Tax=unclassified Enterobacter TaxID=2608935 RepID=UPI00292B3AB9|nr:LysR family transcriptional regulator [Enterobacter sp. 23-M-SZ-13]MDV0596218.1 LysR family transcriptional regulator [Enterobacter sp. 23-M-SZ-13]